MDKSVDLIRETTKSDKVSLFGYCWGGDLVLMYAALHPEKVKNVILVATPGDFSADNTGQNVNLVRQAFEAFNTLVFETKNPWRN